MRRDRTTLLDMEEPDEAPDLQMLSGGAGARLLSVLGQLSRHLGPDSRFTVASNLLQNDLQQLRAQTSGGGGAALSSSPEYEGEDGDDDDTAPSPQLRFPSSSALQEPQVLPPGTACRRLFLRVLVTAASDSPLRPSLAGDAVDVLDAPPPLVRRGHRADVGTTRPTEVGAYA